MSKNFKCPYCNKKYLNKQALYNHIEIKHEDYISEEFPPSRLYFNYINNKEVGSCVICKKPTEWNNVTERYNRFCSEKCKDKYVEEFQKRMIRVHGKTTQQMLQDPEMQKKMLSNRKISGKYKWSDNSAEIQYTGSYELDFLKFLDLFMHFESEDIISPAPQVFTYNDNGTKRFYIPDFYIPSINTLVEIKDGQDNRNNHPNRIGRDAEKEKLKDEIMRNQRDYNFVKVVNKDYSIFLNFLMKLKNNTGDVEEKKERFIPIVDISEEINLIEDRLKVNIINEGNISKLKDTDIPEFNNPEDLSSYMKANIRYKNFDRLMSAKEVFITKSGSCHDQVQFEDYCFNKMDIPHGKIFLIEHNNDNKAGGRTHTLLWYKKDNQFYWFENAWGGEEGIHGPYATLKDLKEEVKNKMLNNSTYKYIEFSNTNGTKIGDTLNDYVKKCLNK